MFAIYCTSAMVYLKIKSRFKIARDMLGNMMEKFEEISKKNTKQLHLKRVCYCLH